MQHESQKMETVLGRPKALEATMEDVSGERNQDYYTVVA
jgi:hypothetical protein